MRYAIFSDLHANRQAWAAVREDISRLGVDVSICLGDVVGYGPKPQEVLESVYEVTQNFVLGNHDAVIGGRLDPEIFNDHAKEIIEWTRQHLNEDARQFFAEVPFTIEGAGFLAVHAEAAQPGRFKYIVNPEDARDSFEATTEQVIFVGHTHHPGRFELSGRHIEKIGSEDFLLEKGKRYVVNTGSVGEPRTPDIHASYCIYDSFQKKIIFRKLPFDIEGYKRDLREMELPIHPYFLDVYESGGGTVVHEPAELAMKRAPKIPAPSHPRHTQQVVVRNEGDPLVTRSFSSAAQAYRAAELTTVPGKGVALWVFLSLAIVLFIGVGIFALTQKGDDDGNGTAGTTPGVETPGGGGGVEFVMGDPAEIPDGITWENLVVTGYKNLAQGALISSDGYSPEADSKGDAAVVDGDAETYLKKVEGKGTYRIAVRFHTPTTISALSLSGGSQHENAAEDFDIYADGNRIGSVRGAIYEENQILVPLPEVSATELELRISKSYSGAPAIRELGIYDWDVKVEDPAIAAAGTGTDPGGTSPVVPDPGGGEKIEPTNPVPPVAAKGPDPIDPHQPITGTDQQTFFVPTAPEGRALWHFTTEAPAANWMQPQFVADDRWAIGEAGFGQGKSFASKIRTPWTTSDIWMRTRFEIPKGQLDRARTWYLSVSCDDGCEVYLNGNRIFNPTKVIPNYAPATMPPGVKNHLIEGINSLAVHCNQEAGEQFIDVGVVSIAAGLPLPGGTPKSIGQIAGMPLGADFLLQDYRNLAKGVNVTRPDNHEIVGPGADQGKMVDGIPTTSWRAKPGGASYALDINFGKKVSFSAISFAPLEGAAPKAVEIKLGGQTIPQNFAASNFQLLRLGRAVNANKITLTVKSWEGDAPGIKELGVYLLTDKGKKPKGDPEKPPPANEKLVALQKGKDGYERAADVRIAVRIIPGTGQPTRAINMGGQPRLIIGTLGGQVNRALLRFDINGKIPEGAKLGDAKLTLSLVKGTQGEKINLYLIHPNNGKWIEGSGTSAGNQVKGEGGATWVAPNSTGRDGWFGGDGLGEPGRAGGYLSLKGGSPVCTGIADATKNVVEFQIPAEVIQLWADRPETNTGILLRIPEENPDNDKQISVHSADSDEADKRPVLELRVME